MKIEINIDTDNQAFEDDFSGEVRRILIEAVEKIADFDTHAYLKDYNGNQVGEFNIKEA